MIKLDDLFQEFPLNTLKNHTESWQAYALMFC